MNLRTLVFKVELRCCYPNCHAQVIQSCSAYADAIDNLDLYSFARQMFQQTEARLIAEFNWQVIDDQQCFCKVHRKEQANHG